MIAEGGAEVIGIGKADLVGHFADVEVGAKQQVTGAVEAKDAQKAGGRLAGHGFDLAV